MTTATDDMRRLLEPQALPNFVETPFIQSIVDRALTYIAAGFPIHLRGASGTGKTTLAIHIAGKLGRPMVMAHGDQEFSTSDLVGGKHGYRMRKVMDDFIQSVLKSEEDMTRRWTDNLLTVAATYGFTFIYDEFIRSRPEANNILLSVLQEKMLDLPPAGDGEAYLRVHPGFTAIFTSNPEECAGVYQCQDALRDRMVTLDLGPFDEETEIAITEARSGLERTDIERIVRIVRGLREFGACEFAPTVRGCIMVAKAMEVQNGSMAAGDPQFQKLCMDILASGSSRGGNTKETSRVKEALNELINRFCR